MPTIQYIRHDPDTVNLVLEAYDSLKSNLPYDRKIKQVDDSVNKSGGLNLSNQDIQRILLGRRENVRGVDKGTKLRIAKDYNSGTSLKDISKKYRTSPDIVLNVLYEVNNRGTYAVKWREKPEDLETITAEPRGSSSDSSKIPLVPGQSPKDTVVERETHRYKKPAYIVTAAGVVALTALAALFWYAYHNKDGSHAPQSAKSSYTSGSSSDKSTQSETSDIMTQPPVQPQVDVNVNVNVNQPGTTAQVSPNAKTKENTSLELLVPECTDTITIKKNDIDYLENLILSDLLIDAHNFASSKGWKYEPSTSGARLYAQQTLEGMIKTACTAPADKDALIKIAIDGYGNLMSQIRIEEALRGMNLQTAKEKAEAAKNIELSQEEKNDIKRQALLTYLNICQ